MLMKQWLMVLGDKNDDECAPVELLSSYWIMIVSTKSDAKEKKMIPFPSHY
jgi:hypothetical protein